MKEIRSEADAYRAMLQALRHTDIKVARSKAPNSDFTITWNGRPIFLDVKRAGHGWPGDVSRTLDTLASEPRDKATVVLFASAFSPSARTILRERRANWIDGSGSLHLEIPGRILISIERHTKQAAAERRFTWSRSAVDIAEFLLSERPGRFSLADVAEATGWSSPRVSKLMQQWDLLGWTSRYGRPRGSGAWRELTAVDAMLEDWAQEVIRPDRRGMTVQAHAVTRDIAVLAGGPLRSSLKQHAGDYAFTSWFAAALLAPYASRVPSAHVYVPESLIHSGEYRLLLAESGLKEVDEGGIVRLEAAGPEVFKWTETTDHVSVASAPRVYADLLEVGGRAADVAGELRRQTLGY